MRQILKLIRSETGAGFAALRRMSLAQKRSDFVSISVAQDDDGADEVRAGLRPPRLGPMAGDALRNVGGLAAIRRRRIDGLLIARSRTWRRRSSRTSRRLCAKAQCSG